MHPEERPQEPQRPMPPPEPAGRESEPQVEWRSPEEPSPRPPSVRPEADYRHEVSLTQRQILGITGGFLLIFGVFAPIVSVPMVGSINILTANLIVGAALILLGTYSAVRALRNDFRFLTWNAYGALAIIGFMLFLVFANAAAGPPPEAEITGMEEAVMQAATLEWGWVVLLLGAFLLIAAGHVNDDFRLRRAN